MPYHRNPATGESYYSPRNLWEATKEAGALLGGNRIWKEPIEEQQAMNQARGTPPIDLLPSPFLPKFDPRPVGGLAPPDPANVGMLDQTMQQAVRGGSAFPEVDAAEMALQQTQINPEQGLHPGMALALREWLRRLKGRVAQEMLDIERELEGMQDRQPMSMPGAGAAQQAPRDPLAPPALMGPEMEM